MIQREKRKQNRLNNTQVNKTSLHATEHDSFHIGLSDMESWELLSKISKESWFLKTGQKMPNRLDKSIVKVFSRESECI
jgi:hypothetical protein